MVVVSRLLDQWAEPNSLEELLTHLMFNVMFGKNVPILHEPDCTAAAGCRRGGTRESPRAVRRRCACMPLAMLVWRCANEGERMATSTRETPVHIPFHDHLEVDE